MWLGLILGALLLAGLAFLGWKFFLGNRQHNIATTIIAGTNTGLEQILPLLDKAEVKKALVPGAEYLVRYFFQALGIAQYKDSSQRLNLSGIPVQAISAVETQIAQSIMGRIHPPQGDLQNLKTQLSSIANNFTGQMNQIQTQQQENVEACAIPVVADVANQLSAILFTSDGDASHKEAFQNALTNALDSTCVDIYKQLSGKGDVGRYLGGGCC